MSSSASSVSFSQTNSPARTTSGMTIMAASVIPRATATVLRAFMRNLLLLRWLSMVGCRSGCCARGRPAAGSSGHLVAECRATRDHLGNVFPGELCEDVLAAGLAGHEQPDDEGSVLLEKED